MRNFLRGGLLTLVVFSTSLITPQFSMAEAPTGAELKEVASIAKKVGSRDNLYDVPENMRGLITASSITYSVPEAILAGLIKKESEFRNIWGFDGTGRGIAQIDSYWHPEVSDNEAFEPSYALPWAAKYLKGLKEEYGNWYNALRAYNGGPNYASWNRGYGGMAVAYITTLYADTIYQFASEYAVSDKVEAIPEISQNTSIKSISAQLSMIENPVSSVVNSLNRAIEDAKNKPCQEASCILPTDFEEVSVAMVDYDEIEPKL